MYLTYHGPLFIIFFSNKYVVHIYIFCWYFLLFHDTFCMRTSESLRNGLTKKHIPFNYHFLHRLQVILILCQNNYTVYILVLKVDFKIIIE